MMNEILAERDVPSVSDMLFAVEDQRYLPLPPTDNTLPILFERMFPTVSSAAGMLDHSYEPRESLVWAPDSVADVIHAEESVDRLGGFVDFMFVLEYL